MSAEEAEPMTYTPTQLQEVEQDGHGACRVQSMETTGSCRSLTRYITCRLPGWWDHLFAMSILSLRTPRRRENWAGLLVDADPFLGVW